ncbi:MAG: transporter substrate-binding domain-containing protein, partial [Bacteroidota bacterium]
MKTQNYLVQIIVLLLLLPILNANSENRELKVGFEIKAPFVIKDSEHYEGVCIDLWEKIADSLNISYTTKEYQLDDLLLAVENGEIDIAISPLTVTATRIRNFGFTQPYYITNLAFATRLKKGNDLMAFFSDFFSIGFAKAFGSLFFIILIFGFIVWLTERKRNPEQFREGMKGVGDGIWWSAVTMSTVGYGDKSPVTQTGRILSMIWMFTAVVVISGLTASVSSSLTVHKLKSQISNFDDLRKISVGCVPNSGTSEFLDQYKINFKDFNNVEAGLRAVDNDSLDAFVYDEAVLKYYVHKYKYAEIIKVIPSAYFKEYFSFASTDYELLKDINVVL